MHMIKVNEEYQVGYVYGLSVGAGSQFDPKFMPQLNPKEMLQAGIFGGNYFNTIPNEFPRQWFDKVKLTQTGTSDPELNCFKVNASQSLRQWQQKGWIYPEDPKGWFLWYCRYYQGRRIADEDARQIGRWQNMKRHISQIQRNCVPGDLSCRPRQRQALLHWAYDSRKL